MPSLLTRFRIRLARGRIVLAYVLALGAAATPAGAFGEGPLDPASPDQYIVVFKEQALAGYVGKVPGYPKPGRVTGKGLLDVKGEASRSYVAYLKGRQQEHETGIAKAIGRTPAVSKRMQHALNAIVASLTPSEAEAVARMPDVLLLDPVRLIPAETDTGPRFIGAGPLWAGTNPGSTMPARGEGMVIGVIDSGINFGSPSFAATDPMDGYSHVNPLGEGKYLGTCASGQVDAGRCNAKLIGGYDFVCGEPGNMCGVANTREEPGFGDTNKHGSHVASTIAGNHRLVDYFGAEVEISGVAPRANVIAYDVCHTYLPNGGGYCPTAASAAAVDQAVADGIVDAINFSIGGGTTPWTHAVSLAFLNATEAGIYVAVSAGNSGPGANTLGHLEPWTSTTAAGQHGRDGEQFLSVTGPEPVDAQLTQVAVALGVSGTSPSSPINAKLVTSPSYSTTNDGCSAYPATKFNDAVALVKRGTCTFSTKINNATAAGAIAVVIANDVDVLAAFSIPDTTVPAFTVTKSNGDALRDWGIKYADATVAISTTPVPNTPDQLAYFSSRGPANDFDLIKPNVTAPGVSILAAGAGPTLEGHESAVDLLNGTSMASPHNAGAALLLRQLKPDWSVPEIKSALEMTATRTVVKENGTTPATPFDMGSGRIRVDLAANAGLLLDETTANFTAANPAIGGDTATLNLASMARRNCLGQCRFVRTFRSPLATGKTWDASLRSLAGSVSPSQFTVPAGGTIQLTITVDASALPPNGNFNFGWLELQPSDGTADDALNLPIAVTVPSGGKLAFTTQPSAGGAFGAAWSTQPVVAVQDTNGGTAAGSSAPVTLTLTTPTGATLACDETTIDAMNGLATFAGCGIDSAGSYTLTASSPGLSSATSAPIAIERGSQAITFDALASKVLGDPDFTLVASADSGLPVDSASQTLDVCEVSGGKVHMISVGTCVIRARQDGDANWLPAQFVERSFTVLPTGVSTAIDGNTGAGPGTANVPESGLGSWVLAPMGTGPMESGGFIPLRGHPKSPPALPPLGWQFPFGLLDFVAINGAPGSNFTITITYPETIPAGVRYMKYGPTQNRPWPHWYAFSNAVVNGNTVTLTITDGGPGDDDLTQDGKIVDAGGIGIMVPPTGIPTLSEWGLLLLSVLLVLASLFMGRRRPL